MVEGVLDVAAAAFTVVAIGDLAVLVQLRRRRLPIGLVHKMLAVALVALAVATTALVRGVYIDLGRVSGVANLAEPIARSSLLVAAVSAQSVLLLLAARGAAASPGSTVSVRRRWVVLAAAVVLLCVAFALSPADHASNAYLVEYGRHPAVVAYLTIYLAYLGWASLDLVRAALRLRHQARSPLREGLTLLAAGAGVGCLYVAARLASQVAVLIDAPQAAAALSGAAVPLGGAAGLAVATGATWPALRQRAPLLRTRWLDYRDRGRLYRLWRDLVALAPGVVLEPARSRTHDAAKVRDATGRLYRRVIELHDARLALQHHCAADPGDGQLLDAEDPTATQPLDPSLAAAMEGAALRNVVAVARHEQDGPAVLGEPPAASTSVRDAVAWWLAVADHYRSASRHVNRWRTAA